MCGKMFLMEESLAQYKAYLQTLGYSPSTRLQYARIAQNFLEYSKGSFSRDIVLAYLALYSTRSGTYRRFITYALKSLFLFLVKSWPLDKRESPKLSRPFRPLLSQDDITKLLQIVSGIPLEHALVTVDAVLGARREELTRIQLDDYQPPNIRVRTAKGGDERVRYIGEEACEVLNRYLDVRRSASPYLFVSSRGVALTPTALSLIFRRMADKAGIPKGVGWHAVRRSVVTWLFDGGMREREIQEVFGWKSVAMPGQYVQLSRGDIEEKVRGAHPRLRQ